MSAEMALSRVADRRHPVADTEPRTPRSFATKPAAYLPHPPLISGGWYHRSSGQEAIGPGRYAVPAAGDRTVGAALVWTFFFGPLGLFYRSTTGGVVATALSLALLIATGSAMTLAAIWPTVMVLSAFPTRNRQSEPS
jgi:hypothetical protein